MTERRHRMQDEHSQSIICCTNTSSSSLSSTTSVVPSYLNGLEYRVIIQLECSTYFEVPFASQIKKAGVRADQRFLSSPRATITDDGEVCKGV